MLQPLHSDYMSERASERGSVMYSVCGYWLRLAGAPALALITKLAHNLFAQQQQQTRLLAFSFAAAQTN
jgi:hypothetical protein